MSYFQKMADQFLTLISTTAIACTPAELYVTIIIKKLDVQISPVFVGLVAFKKSVTRYCDLDGKMGQFDT